MRINYLYIVVPKYRGHKNHPRANHRRSAGGPRRFERENSQKTQHERKHSDVVCYETNANKKFDKIDIKCQSKSCRKCCTKVFDFLENIGVIRKAYVVSQLYLGSLSVTITLDILPMIQLATMCSSQHHAFLFVLIQRWFQTISQFLPWPSIWFAHCVLAFDYLLLRKRSLDGLRNQYQRS